MQAAKTQSVPGAHGAKEKASSSEEEEDLRYDTVSTAGHMPHHLCLQHIHKGKQLQSPQ